MFETSTNPMIEYRRLRAPARDGEALFDPSRDAAAALLDENAARLRDAQADIAGRPLCESAANARRQLLQAAHAYTVQYRDVADPFDKALSASGRVLLAGHQPQLFHPGVLFKNFALSAWGRKLNATAVNLVIDNDAAGAPSLRVLAGSPQEPIVEAVPFDRPGPRIPYEERVIQDASLFRAFGARVRERIHPFVAQPIIERLWPHAQEALERSDNLGRCMAEARHRLEADWGLQTLELPLSLVCRTESFARFVATLLRELPRFRDIHNSALRDYRRVHRLRGHTHPVPDLAQEGEWLEAPFWIWSRDDAARRRLFVRRVNRHEIELTDRQAWTDRFPLCVDNHCDATVEPLLRLDSQGIRLRTRALTTTLYARLFLGDLFLHGIGGAKYDQLTDALIQQFFGLTPPAFYAVTATVRLPIPRPEVTEDDLRRVDWQLRELRFHPEDHLDAPPPEALAHVEAKQRWLATDPPPGQGRARHVGIEQANQALQPFVEPRRRQLEREREELQREFKKARLLGSREFSFCLFPQEWLPNLLHQLLED